MERGRLALNHVGSGGGDGQWNGTGVVGSYRQDFVDRVGKRNGAIAGRRSAVLLIAFINHNYVTEDPMVRGSAQQETIM